MHPVLGFSTGCFWRYNLSISEILQLLLDEGVGAVEIKLQSLDADFSLKACELAKKFDTVFVHSPNISTWSESAVARLRFLAQQVSAQSIVIHPCAVDDFSFLNSSLFAFENMDSLKSSYQYPHEFTEFEDVCFVIDVQHIYELDLSMQLFEEFQSLFDNRLSHLHVSGQSNESNHEALTESENASDICSVLSGMSVPLILEGAPSSECDIRMFIRNESDFIRSFLNL